MNVFEVQKNGISYLEWDGTGTYSWIIAGGVLYREAILDKTIEIDIELINKTVFIANDNDIDYDYWAQYKESFEITSQVKVAFSAVSGAVRYRVKIGGDIDGEKEENGGDTYILYSSPIKTEGSYEIDVEWQDAAGNWSSTAHAYSLYMWELPEPITFAVTAPVAGTFRITVA